MRFRTDRFDVQPEINFIPLIDVLLVILIFLVATTTFKYESAFQISLPQAEISAQPISALELLISQDGQIQVGSTRLDVVTPDTLTNALRAATTEQGRAMLLIRADAQAAHQWVIMAMQAAKRAGIERVSFAVQAVKD
jgi:biopolymer transport protein ExbD